MNTNTTTTNTTSSNVSTDQKFGYYFNHIDDEQNFSAFPAVVQAIRKAVEQFPAGFLDEYLNNQYNKFMYEAAAMTKKADYFEAALETALSDEQRKDVESNGRIIKARAKRNEKKANHALGLSLSHSLSGMSFSITAKEAGIDGAVIEEIADMILHDMDIGKEPLEAGEEDVASQSSEQI